MTSRHSQPEGAAIEPPEETRMRRCELIMRLVGIYVAYLALLTQALLQSGDLNPAQRAALKLTGAALAPIVRRLEALAAFYREGLPESDEQTLDAAGAACLDDARDPLALPAEPPPPAPLPTLAESRPAAPIPWPRPVIGPRAGPRAGPSPPPVLAAKSRLARHAYARP